MEGFNLLREPWILVMTDDKGSTKEVSIIELFQQAHKYKGLAGETSAQDFAVLRFLIAIIHTVFSRFDEDGRVYEWIELDSKYVQNNDVDEEDKEDYNKAIFKTWENLWRLQELPRIIERYLEKWEDRFNLYDDKYPFYQVTEEDLKSRKVEKMGEINLKLVNRLISESNNKIELFSPYCEEYKNNLKDSELVRWLIAFQAYTGTGDKAKYPGMKDSASKGWLLGLGGLYLAGENLKETLLLNMVILPESSKQSPIWEKEIAEKINDLINIMPNNLAELYTNWSRLIMVKEAKTSNKILRAIQLPGMESQEYFLEQMTLWRFAKSGKDKDHIIPKPHNIDQSFWRSFGQISLKSDNNINHKRPGIIDWHNHLVDKGTISAKRSKLIAVGLNYNRDASTMPNDEIYDELNIYNEVLADVSERGWIPRISDEIDRIKKVIDNIFGNFAKDIKIIRNLSGEGFVNKLIQEAYYNIDLPFRQWLSEIHMDDNKEEKIQRWRVCLQKIIIEQAESILTTCGKRDILGVNQDSETEYLNIIIAYNRFSGRLKSELTNKE